MACALASAWLAGARATAQACSYSTWWRLTPPSGQRVPAAGSLFAEGSAPSTLSLTSAGGDVAWTAVAVADNLTRIDYDAGDATSFTATVDETWAWDYVVDPAWSAGDAPRVVQTWRDEPARPDCLTPGLNVQFDRPIGAVHAVLVTDDGEITTHWLGPPTAGDSDDGRSTVLKVPIEWPDVRRELIPGTDVWWHEPEPYPDATLHLRVVEIDGSESDVIGAPLRFAPGAAAVRTTWSEPGEVALVEVPHVPAPTAPPRTNSNLGALLLALLGLLVVASAAAWRLRIRPPHAPGW